jgi:ABC-type phosphate/phosphonate transport system substrate-binding protein
MGTDRIAALPMYDFPELVPVHDALWTAWSDRLIEADVLDSPRRLTRTLGHVETWRHPRLLVGQACEYPLSKSVADGVRLVATPRYAVPGCSGSCYRSAVIVRADEPADSIADLRDRRCVINELDSNSGMNLLRALVAPVAGGRRFFTSVGVSGSHRQSVAMVRDGLADVAAIDCVTFAHLQLLPPALAQDLRILCWTSASPSLPFITARSTTDSMLNAIRTSLALLIADPALAPVRARLFLEGVDLEPADDFRTVKALELEAIEYGYPTLV